MQSLPRYSPHAIASLLRDGRLRTVVMAAGQVAAATPISKDSPDNTEGDDPSEGTGVVDPVPQDDGSDGVDDGTGDAT